MKYLFASGVAVLAATAVTAWSFFGAAPAAAPPAAEPTPPPAVRPAGVSDKLVVHEWGTFTSFSGSDGVPVSFQPNNTDLPSFVYFQESGGKSDRLIGGGTVSMETPVLYFYADRDLRVSARVDFPRGWITEWYPYAAARPAIPNEGAAKSANKQSIRWDVRLLPGEAVRLPHDQQENHYYQARETDAVPLQAEIVEPQGRGVRTVNGGVVVQREKFLFYRGVGFFPPPVTARGLGEGKVRVKNGAGGSVGSLVLVTARGGKLGFRKLDALAAGQEADTTLPETNRTRAELADLLVGELTGAGLYEKEARAMVKTWDDAWFGEEGSRLLYLVPRARTDELLPLTVDPKPTEVVRVLVGRHDFLTPEKEALAERQVKRVKAAQAELQSAEQELNGLGRFAYEARQRAEQKVAKQDGRK